MFKSVALGLSLLANGLMAYALFPTFVSSGDQMTCDQSRDEVQNKIAVRNYAAIKGLSLPETHEFLKNSGYFLRNIGASDWTVDFVYVAKSYWATCGLHWPTIDGSIIRVTTNIAASPKVVGVW